MNVTKYRFDYGHAHQDTDIVYDAADAVGGMLRAGHLGAGILPDGKVLAEWHQGRAGRDDAADA